ncbi:hypothetical protein ACFSQD_15920 [Flavihumibacter stibioxidans]|uniref:Por secretion system C-terminal sorting domain-containing protein n=1 Tax=Flavihumibacter stibioxidans TaxID=1834163 RepID=A0ABR7M7A7_9BACT|nr:hypothetical protein [Flavihumibacter stibioxidans]MBC6490906.1 hypothetical protein [Flavihumibacter stibioxidans]
MSKAYPQTRLSAVFGVKTLFLLLGLSAVQLLAAQSQLSFKKATLVSGEDGKVGAEYLFPAVVTNREGVSLTDCIVRIDAISQGVVLKNIDASTPGNEKAFQPVVEHNNTIGASSVSFSFSFVPAGTGAAGKQLIRFQQLAASLGGLKGFGDAQEFAECNIGKSSQVVFESQNENLVVAKSGQAFRVENKWGVETKESLLRQFENITFVSREVESIQLKFGVNSKMNIWAGTSMFNIVFSQHLPDMTTAFSPVTDNSVLDGLHLVNSNAGEGSKMDKNSKAAEGLRQVAIEVESVYVQDSLKITIPASWVAQEVTIDFYRSNGEIIRKITEHEAARRLSAEMFDLPAGGYLVRMSCRNEYAVQHAIRTESL